VAAGIKLSDRQDMHAMMPTPKQSDRGKEESDFNGILYLKNGTH
jgi:hypothetical protein